MELVYDGSFGYLGYGIHKSFCLVKIYEENDSYVVIMTEPISDSGTSVTNACETIAIDIFNQNLVGNDPNKIIWIEHYKERGEFPETYDRISFTYKTDNRYHSPDWTHIGEELSDKKIKELFKEL